MAVRCENSSNLYTFTPFLLGKRIIICNFATRYERTEFRNDAVYGGGADDATHLQVAGLPQEEPGEQRGHNGPLADGSSHHDTGRTLPAATDAGTQGNGSHSVCHAQPDDARPSLLPLRPCRAIAAKAWAIEPMGPLGRTAGMGRNHDTAHSGKHSRRATAAERHPPTAMGRDGWCAVLPADADLLHVAPQRGPPSHAPRPAGLL